MWLVWTVVIGLVAGWLAAKIVKGRGMGVLADLIVGVIGSFVGGFLFGLVGLAAYGLLARLIMSVVGAVVLLYIVRILRRV